jgi:hypothetical protein
MSISVYRVHAPGYTPRYLCHHHVSVLVVHRGTWSQDLVDRLMRIHTGRYIVARCPNSNLSSKGFESAVYNIRVHKGGVPNPPTTLRYSLLLHRRCLIPPSLTGKKNDQNHQETEGAQADRENDDDHQTGFRATIDGILALQNIRHAG